MKTLKNIFNVLFACVAVIGFWSCDDEVEYTPAEAPTNAQVYFASGLASTVNLSSAENSFTLKVLRATTGTAATVNLSVTDGTNGKLSIPSSVSFDATSNSTDLVIGYNAADFTYDEFAEVSIAIEENSTTPYGIANYTFNVGIPAPWISLGMATYRDDLVTTFWATGNPVYQVEIQENQEVPGLYRLVNPFGANYPYNDPGDWDTTQDYYLEINAQDPEGVYIPLCQMGTDWGYGFWKVWSMANYYMVRQGKSLDEVKAAGYCGTLKDGMITFPAGSLLFGMTNYNDGANYTSNGSGQFLVAMPGVVLADYSAELAYIGLFTGVDGSVQAVAEATLGADVEEAKLVVVSSSESVDATANAIAAGSIESVSISATGEVKIPLPTNATSGKYNIVLVTYGGGQVQKVATATFQYTSAIEETWTEVSTGNYSYSLLYDEPVTEAATLYQSNLDSKRFKIAPWGNECELIFTYDTESGEIYVQECEFGEEYGSYGMISAVDYAIYTEADTPTSYYENGVFNLGLVYFVSAGYIGYGYETFTLDTATLSAASRSVATPVSFSNTKTKLPMIYKPQVFNH